MQDAQLSAETDVQYRVSAHRPPALKLPADPFEAATQALAHIRGDSTFHRASALETMTARVKMLSQGDSDGALETLASQLPVLEALFIKLSVEADEAVKPEHKAILLRLALSAQNSFTRTLTVVAGLRQQRLGKGKVTVIDDVDGIDNDVGDQS